MNLPVLTVLLLQLAVATDTGVVELPADSSPCEFGQWSPWASCSATCDHGRQVRKRPWKVGNQEVANPKTTHYCAALATNSRPCLRQRCPVGCKVGEWTLWTDCSATCGNGIMYRKRPLLESVLSETAVCPSLEEIVACKLQNCDDNDELHSRLHCHQRSDGNYLYLDRPCSHVYYSCAGFVHREHECPDELIFNSATDQCDFRDQVSQCSSAIGMKNTISTNSFIVFLSLLFFITVNNVSANPIL